MKNLQSFPQIFLQMSSCPAPDTIRSSRCEPQQPLCKGEEEFVQWVGYSCHSLISNG